MTGNTVNGSENGARSGAQTLVLLSTPLNVPILRALARGRTAQVESGCVVTSSTLLEQEPETWAIGTPRDWLDTLIDPAAARSEAGGDVALAQVLVESLHEKPAGHSPCGSINFD